MADKVPVPEGEILLREIDDQIQQDELHDAWKRYGVWIIALAVLILVGIGGWQGWMYWRDNQRVADATAYEAALKQAAAQSTSSAAAAADPSAALAAVAGSKGNSYATVAQLALAATLLRQNREKDAVAVYKALSEDTAADPTYRDLATVLYALHGLSVGLDPGVIDTAIKPLSDPSNAFHYSALEIMGLTDLKRGDTAHARDIFSGLASDGAAPKGVQARAQTLAAALGAPPPVKTTTGIAPVGAQ